MKTNWWLMLASLPDLNWAKQKICFDGTVEVYDCDGRVHKFENELKSRYWLLEDGYESFQVLDAEDEAHYGICLSDIRPPKDENLYVKNT